MKTSNNTQTTEKQKEKRFPTEQLQPNHSTAKSKKTQQWLKIIEFAVVGLATWLNPNAGFLIFLLKLCFKILEQLQCKR